MSTTRDAVRELIERVDAVAPSDREPVAEQAARAADQLGADDLRFASRLRLVEAYRHGRDRQRMLVPFGFVLQHYDAAPAWLGRRDRFYVLWYFKWMVSLLVRHPQVPLAQLDDALEGMRRRYAEAGQGMAPVLGCAYTLAAHRHGAAGAVAEYDAWVHAPRTYLSDCQGCEPTRRIVHLAALGRHDEAVAELAPVVRGDVGCDEQPRDAITQALVSLLEVGDVEQAARLHLSALRVSRRNKEVGHLADHVLVLARTGDLGRGLELLAEQLPALEAPPTPFDGLKLAAAATRLLHALVQDGAGDLPVGRHGGQHLSVAELEPRAREQALELAARFDERNGTTTVGDRARRWMQAPPLPPMPLGPAARPGEPSGAAARPRPLDLPAVASHPEVPSLDDLGRLDVTALQQVAEQVRRYAHRPAWEAVAAHWSGRRPVGLAAAQAPAADPALVRAVAELESFAAWASRAPSPDLTGSAARLLRLAGDDAEALLVEQLGAVRAGTRPDPDAFVAAVDEHGTPVQRARARVASQQPGPDGERRRQEGLALLAGTDRDGDAGARLATAHLLLARPAVDGPAASGAPGDEHVHDDVLALLLPGEHPDVRVRVQVDRALARASAGDREGALGLLDDAVAAARVGGAPELVLRALGVRGQVLADAGERQEAEVLLRQVVTACDAVGDHDGGQENRVRLAELLARQGRVLEAVEVVEAALVAEPAAPARSRGGERYRTQVRARLLDLGAQLSVELGEQDRAVALAEEAVDLTADDVAAPVAAARALFRLAQLLSDTEAVRATSLYGRSLERAVEGGATDLSLVVRRERVWARLAADGLDAALADLDDAEAANVRAEQLALTDRTVREALGRWDFRWEPLALAVVRARVLAEQGEPARALAAIDGVPDRMRATRDAEPPALDVELLRGRLLLDLGRTDEGLGALDQVAARARTIGHDGLARAAASAGARWLDAHGRPDDAQRTWDRLVGSEPPDGADD